MPLTGRIKAVPALSTSTGQNSGTAVMGSALTAYKVYEMDALLYHLFCLSSLHTANCSAKKTTATPETASYSVSRDDYKKQQRDNSFQWNQRFDAPVTLLQGACLRPLKRARRAHPSREAPLKTLQGDAGPRAGLTMRCKCERRCASARDKTKQKTRGRTS